MAFIIESGITISFAEYSDVLKTDKRIFDSNEGLSDDVVEEALIRATNRIISKIRSSRWWRDYYLERNGSSITTVADIPEPDIDRIADRQEDFTDLCVYYALAHYILPQVADFGDETDTERAKMGYYTQKSDNLLGELLSAGDWYDFDDDGTIQSDEKELGYYNLRRIR
jgi:hypothetical protein